MTRCTHWRDANHKAVYVGRGPDPRTGLRMTGAKWGNPYSLEDYTPTEAMQGYLAHLRAHPWVVERAREVFAKLDACCWCKVPPGPCHGQVLVALGQGMTLEDAGRLWLAGRLPGMQAGLFGEAV